MRRLDSLIVSAAVVAALACNEPFSPSHDVGLLQLRVSVTPDTVTVGDSATIQLTITNPSVFTVDLGTCHIGYSMRNGDTDSLVASASGVCPVWSEDSPGLDIRIAPGTSKDFTWNWSAAGANGLPPGAYRVLGWVWWTTSRTSPPEVVQVIAAGH